MRHRDYPVGIPIEPPSGWGGRPPGVSRWRVVAAGVLVALMVLACVLAGWLTAQVRRRPVKARAAVVPARPVCRESSERICLEDQSFEEEGKRRARPLGGPDFKGSTQRVLGV
ncbi:MAG: hypothetical protein ACRC33_14210 [Gemmataceae bacterium]